MNTGRIRQGYGIIQREVMTCKISIYSKAVYCLLVSYAGNKEACFPSLKTICTDLAISKNTLIKALKELVSVKLIIADRRKTKDGDFANNIYYPMYAMDYSVVLDVNQGGSSHELPVVHDVNTKNNNIKNNTEELSKDSSPQLFDTGLKQQKSKLNKENARANFKVPAESEVEAYFEEKGHKAEGTKFFNYYESKNWMVGRVKMAKWKAAVNNWVSNIESRNPGSSSQQIILQ